MKIVNIKKFVRSIVILFLVVIAMLLVFSKTTFSHNDKTDVTYKNIDVLSGDTLWHIATREQKNNLYYENKDVREIINEIKKVNHLSDSSIKVGQTIQIPVL